MVRLEDRLLEEGPFAMFAQSRARERERDLQFMTAGLRQSGVTRRFDEEEELVLWCQNRNAFLLLPRADLLCALQMSVQILLLPVRQATCAAAASTQGAAARCARCTPRG